MRALIFTLALALSGCAGLILEDSGTDTIDNSYQVTGFSWQSGVSVYFFVKAREKNGTTELCGAWAAKGENFISIRLNDQAVDSAMLFSGNDKLAHGAGFLNPLSDVDNVVGKTASCVLTDRPWKPEYAENISTRMSPAAIVL